MITLTNIVKNILRPQEISNNPGIARRIGTVTNTAIEFDILGTLTLLILWVAKWWTVLAALATSLVAHTWLFSVLTLWQKVETLAPSFHLYLRCRSLRTWHYDFLYRTRRSWLPWFEPSGTCSYNHRKLCTPWLQPALTEYLEKALSRTKECPYTNKALSAFTATATETGRRKQLVF